MLAACSPELREQYEAAEQSKVAQKWSYSCVSFAHHLLTYCQRLFLPEKGISAACKVPIDHPIRLTSPFIWLRHTNRLQACDVIWFFSYPCISYFSALFGFGFVAAKMIELWTIFWKFSVSILSHQAAGSVFSPWPRLTLHKNKIQREPPPWGIHFKFGEKWILLPCELEYWMAIPIPINIGLENPLPAGLLFKTKSGVMLLYIRSGQMLYSYTMEKFTVANFVSFKSKSIKCLNKQWYSGRLF